MRLSSPVDLNTGGGIQHKRMTRSALTSLAGSSGLLVGQVYYITDEGKLAVATASGAYTAFEPESEYGSNGNGHYLKHASGVLECWGIGVASAPCNVAVGTNWRGSGTWTFPEAFVDSSVVVTATSRATVRNFYYSTSTATVATLWHSRIDGGGSSATVTPFDARATGRWK